MAVALRLMRMGKKNSPSYRIVAVDKRKKRNAAYIESLGYYNPLKNPPELTLDKEKIDSWLKKGAVLSEGISKLLKSKMAKMAMTKT